MQRSIRQSILSTYPLLAPHIDEVLPKKASLTQVKLPERVSLYVLDDGRPLFYQQDADGVLLPHLRLVHRFPRCFPSVRIDRGAIRFVLSGATLMAPGLTSKGGRLPIPVDRAAAAAAAAGEGQQQENKEEGGQEKEKKEAASGGAGGGEGGEEGEDDDGEAAPAVPNEGPDEDGHWSRELEKGEPVVVMAEGKEEAAAVGLLIMGTKEIKEKGKGPVMEEMHYLGDGLWRLHLD